MFFVIDEKIDIADSFRIKLSLFLIIYRCPICRSLVFVVVSDRRYHYDDAWLTYEALHHYSFWS